MTRPFLTALALMGLLLGGARAEDKENPGKDAAHSTNVTITKMDAKNGQFTVRFTDDQGKPQEKTFRLTEDVRLLDETGRVVKIDVFESGNEALVIEKAGKLQEFRRMPTRSARHLSDTMRTLIEMSDCDEACATDLQKVYDMLRKLDPKKDGKIDPQALKAEAASILQERVKEIFSRLDTDKDGKISKDEARGLIKEHFDKIDTNKDGFIDTDELLKAARERHEQKAADAKATEINPTEKEKK